MVTMFKPKPQLMRSVAKPDNVSTKELAQARPVYIDGLPEGGGGGGASTTDAITIKGIPDDDELNGMQLNDFITELVDGLEAGTTSAITVSGIPDVAADGTPLNDLLTSYEETLHAIDTSVLDLLSRVDALEAAAEA